MGKMWKQCHFSFSWAPKSMQMVTTAKILKDACCLVLDLRGNAFSLSLLSMMLAVRLSSVQLLTWVWLFATLWTTALQGSLSINNSRSLLKLMSTESVMPSSHLIFCHPLLLLPSVFPSIRFFSNESVLCIRWPKYWSFSFDISPSNEYSGLILQHHSSKAFILLCSAFFIVPTLISIHTWLLEKP